MAYYDERKWCAHCGDYVRYLLSLQGSYCVHCGAEVHLFNDADLKQFKKSLEARGPLRRPFRETS